MFGIKGKCLDDLPKCSLAITLKNCKVSPLKNFTEKHIFLNFENLPTMFCPKLYIRIYSFVLNCSEGYFTVFGKKLPPRSYNYHGRVAKIPACLS